MRFVAERSAAWSAGEWRVFWQERGMRELGEVVSTVWPPLAGAAVDAGETCLFRIASLLVSRASATALADELGRIRRDLGHERDALADARAGHAIAAWFAEAARR